MVLCAILVVIEIGYKTFLFSFFLHIEIFQAVCVKFLSSCRFTELCVQRSILIFLDDFESVWVFFFLFVCLF